MTFAPEILSHYEGVRVAVFGASGFIGRWVARGLTSVNAKPILLVRDVEAAGRIFQEYGIQGESIAVDITDERQTRRALADTQPAVTFNLAGYGVDPAERDVDLAYAINDRFVTTLCRALAELPDSRWPGPRLVHVGSALEYGAIEGDLAEDTVPRPTTLYGRSKLAGTRNLIASCQAPGVSGLTARLFTVYGPGEHRDRLLPTLFRAAASGELVSLTDGKQQRDFTYVEDIAEGLLGLAAKQAQPGEVLNLASGNLLEVRAFVEMAARILGIAAGNLKFGVLPTRAEEMWHSRVNVERLRQRLGWTPPSDIEPGIRKTKAILEALGSSP